MNHLLNSSFWQGGEGSYEIASKIQESGYGGCCPPTSVVGGQESTIGKLKKKKNKKKKKQEKHAEF